MKEGKMYEWHKNMQTIVDEIDICIKNKDDEALTLKHLADRLRNFTFQGNSVRYRA